LSVLAPVPNRRTTTTGRAAPADGPVADAAAVAEPRPSRTRFGRLGAYVALTKPRIIELLLVTTVPPMILADRGLPSWTLILATLVGGSLAAGSANTINCYVDRDIDQLMKRTSRRPLVKDAVSPVAALRFGIVLGALATLWLGFLVNWPSALLADAAILFYVFVYTLGLKRRSSSNIVIGGAAGCFPVIIGWSAVTGTVGWPAVLLFAVVFLWTPPHFWALAMRFKDDYAAAGVPMLPVVATPVVVARRILVYSYLMVATSLLLVPVGHTGVLYGAVAAGAGVWFIAEAHALLWRVQADKPAKTMRLFHLSITYLTLVFLAVALDQLI
jgi:protoheme IX farnesyltransferase